METGFGRFHPAAALLYFVSVLTVTMVIMNPVLLIISCAAAVLNIAYFGGINAVFHYLKLTFFTSVMIIVINPLISHKGITILLYLPDGNPLTLESVIFGIAAAVMMSCIFAWFYTINRVFTSDKIICLFGNFMPKIALLISMTLNFAEKFIIKLRDVRAVQSTIGIDTAKGSLMKRLKNSVTIFSIMIQWAMESSVDTADSMKSRGYGLKKRTSYTVYRIFPRDIIMLVFILICDALILTAFRSGAVNYSYYPSFSFGIQIINIAVYFIFAALCLMPLLINIREDGKWKYIRSNI